MTIIRYAMVLSFLKANLVDFTEKKLIFLISLVLSLSLTGSTLALSRRGIVMYREKVGIVTHSNMYFACFKTN